MTPADDRRFAPATQRNRDPILAVLNEVLPESGLILELASGSGEHAVYFASRLRGIDWQPSDPSPEARGSIAAWIDAEGLGNLLPPLDVDAASDRWPILAADAVVCINMIHISPWAATEGLMRGAGRLLAQGAPLCLYGPFRRSDRPLESSNEAFDRDLRARDSRWGLREIDEVAACAAAHGFRLDRIEEMPAKNLTVVFRKD